MNQSTIFPDAGVGFSTTSPTSTGHDGQSSETLPNADNISSALMPQECALTFNSSSSTWDYAEVEEWTFIIINSVANPLLSFFGAPANLLSMLVFYQQGLNSRINLCLFCSGLADLMTNFSSLVIHAETFFSLFSKYQHFSNSLVLTITKGVVVLFGFSYVSYLITAIVSVERCWCVVKPLQAHAHLQTRSMAALLFFLFVAVVGLYYVSAARWKIACIFDANSGDSRLTFTDNDFYAQNRSLVDAVEGYVFGVLILSLCLPVVLVTTFITIKKLRVNVRWRDSSVASSQSRKEITLTKMLIGTSVLFIVCVTPSCLCVFTSCVVSEFRSAGRYHSIFLAVTSITEFLSSLKASVNSCVYYSLGSRYRETVKSICKYCMKLFWRKSQIRT